jgi:hypothetical protein
MDMQTQKNYQRIMATASALVIIGGGLNILVLETPDSFDIASVILALFVGFWALALGGIGLILSPLWLFVQSKIMRSEHTSGQPADHGHRPIGLRTFGHGRMC